MTVNHVKNCPQQESFPNAALIIPPDSDAVYNTNAHLQRNQNLQDIKTFGRMHWEKYKPIAIEIFQNYRFSDIKKYWVASCMREN